ncbi:MAG: TIGR03013 family PEP-CTERM/XrtA system glycosyltransferase [Candidatus Competibacter sp.]|nr:TIGR03013 family PEP-CTERM/XrtA system glycosyltransferase [Candidatus Competibacter sp.]MDG4585778.1 TIGR03013 family PEP-CTERM/XrtA system glycosyltransferase [Candidatus Competibacter sp.]
MMRLLRHYGSQALLVLVVVEAFSLFWSIYIGRSLYFMWIQGEDGSGTDELALSATAFMIIMSTIMVALGLYERNFWNGKGEMLLRVGVGFLVGLFAMTLFYYLVPSLALGRGEFGSAMGIAFLSILLLRFIFFKVSKHDRFKYRVLVLGVGEQAARIEALRQPGTPGFLVAGYIQVHEHETPRVPAARILQAIGNLSDLADGLRIDEIVVAMDDRRKGFPFDEILDCKINGIAISHFLDFFERQTGKVQLEALMPSSIVFAESFQGMGLRSAVKRVLDITASLLLLALTWPFMLAAVLAIWLESGGREPILYRQTRVGFKDRLFEVIKFRSMVVDAEKDGKARWAGKNDLRITRVGAVLRETRIDELPQLFNVLRGDMSFVGPRPERPQFVADLCRAIPCYSMRHMVKPGITGWAQICYCYGASEKDAREKLQYDLYYIKNYSFFFDVVILLQTVHTILWGRGAH